MGSRHQPKLNEVIASRSPSGDCLPMRIPASPIRPRRSVVGPEGEPGRCADEALCHRPPPRALIRLKLDAASGGRIKPLIVGVAAAGLPVAPARAAAVVGREMRGLGFRGFRGRGGTGRRFRGFRGSRYTGGRVRSTAGPLAGIWPPGCGRQRIACRNGFGGQSYLPACQPAGSDEMPAAMAIPSRARPIHFNAAGDLIREPRR